MEQFLSYQKKATKLKNDLSFINWFEWMFTMIEGAFPSVNILYCEFIEKLENLMHCLTDESKYNKLTAYERSALETTIINICPGIGKSTILRYFTVWHWIQNPRSNTIWLIGGESLLKDWSGALYNILTHPMFKICYPYIGMKDLQFASIDYVSAEGDTKWKVYDEKNKYSIHKSLNRITNPSGGTIVLLTPNTSVAGLRYGIRGNKFKYCGFLGLDDPDDLSKGSSQSAKVFDLFSKSFKGRVHIGCLAPTIVSQQRLKINDLSGRIIEYYDKNSIHYTHIKIKAFDENKQLRVKELLTDTRTQEILSSNNLFHSQYQQEPIAEGGLIDVDRAFEFYEEHNMSNLDIDYTLITIDTANKKGEKNDYSAISLWGMSRDGQLYLLDMIREKLNWHELTDACRIFLNKYTVILFNKKGYVNLSNIYIEDAQSGSVLIQSLEGQIQTKLTPLIRTKSKRIRYDEIENQLYEKKIFLPKHKKYTNALLEEAMRFDGEGSFHDDALDTMFDAVKFTYVLDSTNYGNKINIAFNEFYSN